MKTEKEKLFQLAGIVIGLISLARAVVAIPTDFLVRAIFMMVFVTCLIVVTTVDGPSSRG